MIKYINKILFLTIIAAIASCDSFEEDRVPGPFEENPIIIHDDEIVAAPGKPLVVDLLSNDEIYEDANFSIKQQPENGSAELIDGALLFYTPNPNFTKGTDEVIYEICTNSEICDQGSVIITLTDDETMHSCEADNYYFSFVEMNTPKEIDLLHDSVIVDGVSVQVEITICDNNPIDPTSFEIVSQPEFGSLRISNNGIATYTPNSNYLGKDLAVLKYKVLNADEAVYYSMLEFDVYDNRACEIFLVVEDIIDVYGNLEVGNKYEINPLVNDYYCIENVDFSSLAITGNPTYGSVVITDSLNFVYTIDQVTTALSDEFKYTLCNNDGDCYQTIVTVNFHENITSCEFKALNDNYVIYLSEHGSDTTQFYLDVLANDVICSNNPDKIELSIVHPASVGSVKIIGDSIVYTRPDGFLDKTFFAYRICNDTECDEAWVDILFLE